MPGRTHKQSTAPIFRRKTAKHPSEYVLQKSITFTLAAPDGRNVSIAGTFNNWEPQAMTKGPDGRWRITLRLAPGTYEYKFLVDTEWRDDPNNPPRRTANEQGAFNSICQVL
jgi:1,4-alpha-glucan branching enzyme